MPCAILRGAALQNVSNFFPDDDPARARLELASERVRPKDVQELARCAGGADDHSTASPQFMVWWRRSDKHPTVDGDASSVFSLDSGSLSAADTSLALPVSAGSRPAMLCSCSSASRQTLAGAKGLYCGSRAMLALRVASF